MCVCGWYDINAQNKILHDSNMTTTRKNKNKIINCTQRQTGGSSFHSFITADANSEYGGKKKGMDVKLEKRNGNPNAWLIGGDAFWDSTFEELKKGAKSGRYKKFIDELMKTYPRFNSLTRPNVGKGIKISHAMFCKLFAPDSALGRMYPKLIAKIKKRNYCQYTSIPNAIPKAIPKQNEMIHSNGADSMRMISRFSSSVMCRI